MNIYVDEIVKDKLGGIRKAAQLLKRPHSSINNWINRGRIPTENWPDILKVAEENSLSVTKEDLLKTVLE